jgi:hypothetical protein
MTKRPADFDITVDHIETDDPLALYEKFRGQNQRQPVFVELDLESGDLSAYVSPDIGNGMPERVYNRRAIRWEIPVLTPEACNALLDEIEPHAGILWDGSTIEFDGRNHVGTLDDDAQDAVQTISDLCDEGRFSEAQRVSVWDADDYLSPVGSDSAQSRSFRVTAATTDDELRTRADELTAEAATENHHLDADDVRRYLTALRARLADAESN